MYIIKYRSSNGEWVSWGSTANPRIVAQFQQLLNLAHPGRPQKVDKK